MSKRRAVSTLCVGTAVAVALLAGTGRDSSAQRRGQPPPPGTRTSSRGQPTPRPPTMLLLIDSLGVQVPLDLKPAPYYVNPRFSPDGGRVSYTSTARGDNPPFAPRVYDLTTRKVTSFSENSALLTGPVWSADGTELAYAVRTGTGCAIVTRAATGRGRPDTLIVRDEGWMMFPIGFAADHFLFRLSTGAFFQGVASGAPMALVRANNRWMPRQMRLVEGAERQGDLSADGRWVVYESDVPPQPAASPSGAAQGSGGYIYVRSFPELGPPMLVSESRGMNPRWSGDGRTIYYWERLGPSTVRGAPGAIPGGPPASAMMIAAAVHVDSAVTVVSRRKMFSVVAARPDYAVSPVREAFIVVLAAPAKR